MKKQIVIKYISFTCLTLLTLCFVAPNLWAQGAVSQLQQKVQQLEQVNQKNNKDVAQAMNLLANIQRQFQSIKGQVDASKYLNKESDRVYQDLDLRVSSLEDKIDQIHALLKEISTNQKAGQPMAPKSAGEYEEFQTLLAMLNARDYRNSASGFLGFLRKYPQSSYASKAMYWVGESFYFLGDYARAIQEFQKLVEKYPQSAQVKGAILRQGLAFSRLKKYPEAKLFYQKVMANYPNSVEAAKAQSRLHRIEEMEKNQIALSESPSGQAPVNQPQVNQPKSSSGTQPEVSANKPIMKPAPYPRPATQPKPAGEATAPSQPEQPAEPTRPAGRDSSTPLF